jgi:hypothetical protein
MSATANLSRHLLRRPVSGKPAVANCIAGSAMVVAARPPPRLGREGRIAG